MKLAIAGKQPTKTATTMDAEKKKEFMARAASRASVVDPAEDVKQTLLMKRMQNAGPDETCSVMVDKMSLENIKSADRWGNTALHYAAVWGCNMTASRLLRAGADPRARTVSGDEYKKVGSEGSKGPTALELAAMHGNEMVMTTLLNQPDPVPAEELKEALYASARFGVIIQALLDEGNFDDEALATALAIAVRNGREKAALTLIGNGELLQLPVDLNLAIAIHEAERGAEDKEAREEKTKVVKKLSGEKVLTNANGGSAPKGAPSSAADLGEESADIAAERGEFQWAAGETVGSKMIMISLRHDIEHLTPILITKGAGPGFVDYVPKELHIETSSFKKPFALALKREAFTEAIRMLPAGFLTQPGTALYAGLCISEAAQIAANRLRVVNPRQTLVLRRLGLEAELTTLALMHTLPEMRQVDLLRSQEGEDFIRLAARLDSTAVLSQPIVQQDMKVRWLGGVLHALLHGRGVNAWGDRIHLRFYNRLVLALLFPLLLLINLLFIPVMAFAPFVERHVLTTLNKFGVMGERDGKLKGSGFSPFFMIWMSDLWILGSPLVKSSLIKITNIALALLIILDVTPAWLTLAWSASIFLTEVVRVYKGLPFIKWASWMLILASFLLLLGSGLDFVSTTYVPYETGRGFLSLGVLLLLLNAVGLLFLQSSFLGPMVTTISQMLTDALSWVATLIAGVLIWTSGFYVNMSADAGEGTLGGVDEEGNLIPPSNSTADVSGTLRYLLNLGLKVSPLLGAKPLIVQGDQDPFEYVLLLSYYLIQSVMLYSMLVALFSTRLTRDEATRIPKFHLSFCKLVLNEHLRPTAPPPLAVLNLFDHFFGWLADCMRTERERVKRAKTFVERASTRSQFKHDSTPEKTWHTPDYMRDNPPTRLLVKTTERVEGELLKLEGPLMALTSDTKFKGLTSLLSDTGGEIKEHFENGVDALMRRVQGLGKEFDKDLQAAVHTIRGPDAPPPPEGQMSTRRAVQIIEKRLVERFSQKWRRSAEGQNSKKPKVKIYKGFAETADRLIFPYGMHAARFGNKVATHMTILSNGKVENPAKRLWLTGKFTNADRPELERQPEKELLDMLKKRLENDEYEKVKAQNLGKPKHIEMLIGMDRETELDERALCAFPFLQSMSKKDANAHRSAPNNVFVRKRDNGSWGVAHCWPVKYNDAFKKQFEEFRPFFEPRDPPDPEKKPRKPVDPSRFSPRAAIEFKECMERLFGSKFYGNVKVIFASKEMLNPHLALVGTVENIVGYLRQNPTLQRILGIVKMHPDGFTARVMAKGKFSTFKQFGMAADGTLQVAYVKAGFETMACVKPLDLFERDCKFGEVLEGDTLSKYINEKVMEDIKETKEREKQAREKQAKEEAAKEAAEPALDKDKNLKA